MCAFLEPIALYHTRDLLQAGDGGWLARYDPPGLWPAGYVPLGSGRRYGDRPRPHHHHVRQRAADEPAGGRPGLGADGIGCRVLDLRWIAPLPEEDILREAAATGRVLVADETRRTGGVSEAVVTTLIDAGFTGKITRVNSEDSFIPLV